MSFRLFSEVLQVKDLALSRITFSRLFVPGPRSGNGKSFGFEQRNLILILHYDNVNKCLKKTSESRCNSIRKLHQIRMLVQIQIVLNASYLLFIQINHYFIHVEQSSRQLPRYTNITMAPFFYSALTDFAREKNFKRSLLPWQRYGYVRKCNSIAAHVKTAQR